MHLAEYKTQLRATFISDKDVDTAHALTFSSFFHSNTEKNRPFSTWYVSVCMCSYLLSVFSSSLWNKGEWKLNSAGSLQQNKIFSNIRTELI